MDNIPNRPWIVVHCTVAPDGTIWGQLTHREPPQPLTAAMLEPYIQKEEYIKSEMTRRRLEAEASLARDKIFAPRPRPAIPSAPFDDLEL